MKPERLHILDTPVDAVDMDGALAFVEDAVKTRTSAGVILAVNPEKMRFSRISSKKPHC